MASLWWFLLVVTIGSLVYNVAKHLEYRRRQTPLPAYWVGGVWSGLSMVLLIVSNLLEMDGPLAIAALSGSFILLALAITQSARASRRRM